VKIGFDLSALIGFSSSTLTDPTDIHSRSRERGISFEAEREKSALPDEIDLQATSPIEFKLKSLKRIFVCGVALAMRMPESYGHGWFWQTQKEADKGVKGVNQNPPLAPPGRGTGGNGGFHPNFCVVRVFRGLNSVDG
jgi:hypothetical protein